MKDKQKNTFPCDNCKDRDSTKCIDCLLPGEWIESRDKAGDVYSKLRHQLKDEIATKATLTEFRLKSRKGPKYETVRIGKENRTYKILNPEARGRAWISEKVKRLPPDADVINETVLHPGRVKDQLIANVADTLSKDRAITYEKAVLTVYKTSRPCKNPSCISRIPSTHYVDKRTEYCSEACRKDHSRNKIK